MTTTSKAKLSKGMDVLGLVGALIDTCTIATEGIDAINADDETAKALSGLRQSLEHVSSLLTDGMVLLEQGGAR